MNGLPASFGPESESRGAPLGPEIDLRLILAPVDFSAASQRGLEFAGGLAGQFHSRLHLLHVVEPPVLPEWGYAHIPMREARLRRSAAERLPQFPSECGIDPRLVHSTEVRSGEAAEEVCKAAAINRSDLVVIASHGLGGIQHAFAGSTSEYVVRRAPCPVLTVREKVFQKKCAGASGYELKHIIVTTDFSEESKKAFPYALALARKFAGALLLLHVVPAHLPAEFSHIGIVLEETRVLEEARARLPGFAQAGFGSQPSMSMLVLNGGPANEICRTAEVQEAGLIVMATHGHTGMKRLLLGSVTEQVVRHAPCPVLVVRDREREFVKG